MPNRLIR